MWILSISQRLGPAPDDTRRLLQNRLLFFRMPRQIRTDQMVVMGRMPKDFRGQFSPCSQSRIPRRFHFLLHQPVVGRIGHHRYRLMILRRTPQHTRSTDIDIFDRLLRRAVGPRHRLLKRIKIHHHQIDRRNLVLCRLLTMCRQIPSLQKPSVHLGMQRLHPSIHHFWETSVVAQLHHLHPCVPQSFSRSPGRNQLHPFSRQEFGELQQPRLVRNRK